FCPLGAAPRLSSRNNNNGGAAPQRSSTFLFGRSTISRCCYFSEREPHVELSAGGELRPATPDAFGREQPQQRLCASTWRRFASAGQFASAFCPKRNRQKQARSANIHPSPSLGRERRQYYSGAVEPRE